MADLDSTVDDPNLTASFRPVAHPEWSASRSVRVTHVGAVSGVVWGLIVVGILNLSLGRAPLSVVATSLLVSPLIGIAASRAIWPIRSRSLLIRTIASGLLLYAAGALYGFANFGLETFDPYQGATGIIEKVHVALVGAAVFPYFMTITGIVLVLWPLAFANSVMVWRIDGNAVAPAIADPKMLIVLLDEPGLAVFESFADAVRYIEPPDAEVELRAAFDDAAVPYRVEWLKPNRRSKILGIETIGFGKYRFVPAGEPDPAGLLALLEAHLEHTEPSDVRSALQTVLERHREGR